MSDLFYEKSKMYYENYKAGKLTKKVGSIIKNGNKYLTILRPGKRAMFPGGSVEKGEPVRQAVEREALEECGAKITKLRLIKKDYYSVDWDFEGITFPNKRVSYTYLCEIEDGDLAIQGLEGEFAEGTTLKWCSIEELEELRLWEPTLELVRKVEAEQEHSSI